MLDDTDEGFARECKALADQFLSVIEAAAKATDVACETDLVIDHPYEAIIKAAEEKGCDLIAMASHGRKGVQGLTLGSETQKGFDQQQNTRARVSLRAPVYVRQLHCARIAAIASQRACSIWGSVSVSIS